MSDTDREFSSGELREYLTAVDRHLKRKVTMKILGGSACMLAYEVDRTTRDIDTFETSYRGLRRALKKATEETGLQIPVSPQGGDVGDWPYNSDDRLVRIMPRLTRLRVYGLEAHDLALSKAVRGWEKDFAAVHALHQSQPLDLEILYQRYVDELDSAIGRESSRDWNFFALIDRLFGTATAFEVKARLEKFRKNKPRL